MYPSEINCGVCNKLVVVQSITSTNSIGSPDLDTRPAPMRRYNLSVEINRCPHCGYCRCNLETANEGDKKIVNQERYQSQLSNTNFPETANRYLCQALLDGEAKNLANQFWSYLYAAWACDDEGNIAASTTCRLNAAKTAQYCVDNQISFGGDRDSEIAIMVDTLRRAKQFELARSILKTHEGNCQNDTVDIVLQFQERLISNNDFQRYTIEQAFEAVDN